MAQRAARRKLPAIVDLVQAEKFRDKLVAARGKPVVIDASAVQRLSVPGIQVLLSARKTWAADGIGFSVKAPSSRFTEALSILAVSHAAIGLEDRSR